MIIKAIYNYYINNGEPAKIENNEFASQEGEIYEVVRIIDGIPLFLEDHIERFFNSAAIAGLIIETNTDEIGVRINKLININQASVGNIRFSYLTGFRAFFIQHRYPGQNDYREGIQCGLLHRERVNPQAKTMQENVRGTADQLLSETGFHEVLLIDQHNHVTEGSRSNLFFIKEGCFYTPSSSDVLPGTTRKRIICMIRQMGLPLTEEKISVNDLPEFEAAFLTGTSPKILPIKKVDDYSFRTDNVLMRELMKKYDEMVNNYLFQKKTTQNSEL